MDKYCCVWKHQILIWKIIKKVNAKVSHGASKMQLLDYASNTGSQVTLHFSMTSVVMRTVLVYNGVTKYVTLKNELECKIHAL